MQKKFIPGFLFFFLFISLNGQSVVDRPIVWQVPAMPSVNTQDYIIQHHNDTLRFTVYQALNYQAGQQLPAIVFANGGIEDLPNWRVYQDWARLMATQGFMAILHHSNRENRFEQLGQILDYCHSKGASIGIDGQKIGVWACSGNVTAAFPQLMDEKRKYLKAASLYYGMPNNIGKIRQSLPIQIVRAGFDTYSLNRKIDQFLINALKEDISLDFINYLEGYHGFDILNDTPRSRQIMQQTIQFFKHHLSSETKPSGKVLTSTNFYEMVIRGEWDEAARLMQEMLEADKANNRPFRGYYRVADENNLNWTGYQLIREGRAKEAVFVMQLNHSLFPESANAYDSLADAFEANKEPHKALEWAKKTLDFIEKNTNISERQRGLLKESAEEKIKRLQ